MKLLWNKIKLKLHKTGHVAEHYVHCFYLLAVSVEAHGYYGKVAGFLLCLTLINFFVGED